MPRCDLCFKDKSPLQPPFPKCPAKVCKACFYEIDRILGFFEHYGFTLIGQAALPLPTKATKSKSRPSKSKKNTITLENAKDTVNSH